MLAPSASVNTCKYRLFEITDIPESYYLCQPAAATSLIWFMFGLIWSDIKYEGLGLSPIEQWFYGSCIGYVQDNSTLRTPHDKGAKDHDAQMIGSSIRRDLGSIIC